MRRRPQPGARGVNRAGLGTWWAMEEERVKAPRPRQRHHALSGAGAATGEPMTAEQASYLHSLCAEAGERFDGSLTAAEAAQRIEELKAEVGRGGDDPPRQADRER